MASDIKPLQQLNTQAKQAIDQTTEQARGAVDTYFDFLRKAISSYPTGGTEVGEKLKSYVEKNVALMHEHVQKLSQAKDFQEIVRLQTEFMQTQMNSFGEQTKSVSEAFTKAASGPAKMPF
jgi:hypothetical protein